MANLVCENFEKNAIQEASENQHEQSMKKISDDVAMAVGKVKEAKYQEDNTFLDESVLHALRYLVEQYGTEAYEFNLTMEHFVKDTLDGFADDLSSDIEDPLVRILADQIPKSETTLDIRELKNKVLFAAYYALSLIYKKTKNIKGLEDLAKHPGYRCLNKFPLFYEVQSRYYKRIGALRQALNRDQYAISVLANNASSGVNHGVRISYASTVCSMLESNILLWQEEINQATEFVDAAVKYNPKYAKYYFIKAQLIYYTGIKSNLDDFERICTETIQLTEKARMYVFYSSGTFIEQEKEMDVYEAFIQKVHAELLSRKRRESNAKFIDFSADEIASLKHNIMASNKCDDDIQPIKPNLSPDDKYIFICYSSKDYKSVYCDLVEFYAQKIPFVYDKGLGAGLNWDAQVETYIDQPNCVGVVFYISTNTLISESFCEEIEMVCQQLKKAYFAVNLEGALLPSAILVRTILNECDKDMSRSPISSDNIIRFLRAFTDKGIFIPKFRDKHEDGIQHIHAFKYQLRKTFQLDS